MAKRARTDAGHFVADDPSTPDVNEAFVQEAPKKKRAKKKVSSDLPPVGSAERKRLILLGEIDE